MENLLRVRILTSHVCCISSSNNSPDKTWLFIDKAGNWATSVQNSWEEVVWAYDRFASRFPRCRCSSKYAWAADRAGNGPVLPAAFHQGLRRDVVKELSCRHVESFHLDGLTDGAIHLNKLLVQRWKFALKSEAPIKQAFYCAETMLLFTWGTFRPNSSRN